MIALCGRTTAPTGATLSIEPLPIDPVSIIWLAIPRTTICHVWQDPDAGRVVSLCGRWEAGHSTLTPTGSQRKVCRHCEAILRSRLGVAVQPSPRASRWPCTMTEFMVALTRAAAGEDPEDLFREYTIPVRRLT
jgi:hypothetical protein